MKLLNIRIPMAPPNAIVSQEQEPALKRAAFEELCGLIPDLSKLKGSIPGIGTQAFDNQLCLTVTLAATPQLSLQLSRTPASLGRVVELEATFVDQVVIRNSIQLTQDLLSQVGEGLPDALAEWRDRFVDVERRRTKNRLRRELGRRYEISVFDQPEVVALPDLQPTKLEPHDRSVSLIVTEMYGRRSFQADHLQDVTGSDLQPLTFDPRQTLMLLRRGRSTTFDVGALLHQSMESAVRIIVVGRMVIHAVSDSPIAFEVDQVDAPVDKLAGAPSIKTANEVHGLRCQA